MPLTVRFRATFQEWTATLFMAGRRTCGAGVFLAREIWLDNKVGPSHRPKNDVNMYRLIGLPSLSACESFNVPVQKERGWR